MEPLLDPLNNRVVKNLPPPPHRPLATNLMFKGDKVNWSLVRDFLKKEGRIAIKDMLKLIDMALHVFGNTLFDHLAHEPNLLNIDDPVTIVGDIHGQFYDLLKAIENDVGGNP